MPTPMKGESQKDYMDRCMAYPDMQKHPTAQRVAMCESMYKAKKHNLYEKHRILFHVLTQRQMSPCAIAAELCRVEGI